MWQSGARRAGKPVMLTNIRVTGKSRPYYNRAATKRQPSDRRAAIQLKRGEQNEQKKKAGKRNQNSQKRTHLGGAVAPQWEET